MQLLASAQWAHVASSRAHLKQPVTRLHAEGAAVVVYGESIHGAGFVTDEKLCPMGGIEGCKCQIHSLEKLSGLPRQIGKQHRAAVNLVKMFPLADVDRLHGIVDLRVVS